MKLLLFLDIPVLELGLNGLVIIFVGTGGGLAEHLALCDLADG